MFKAKKNIFVDYTDNSNQYFIVTRKFNIQKMTNFIFLENKKEFLAYRHSNKVFDLFNKEDEIAD